MTENTNKKKRRPLRTALICVAAAAMMVVGVSAANPGMVEEFAGCITKIIQVNTYKMEMTTQDGSKVTVYAVPQATVENRDGRAILLINGEDAADITDELNAEGRFCYEGVSGESSLTITVEGTAEEWTASVMVGDPDGPIYTYSSMQDGKGVMSSPAVSVESDASIKASDDIYVTVTTHDSETLEDVVIGTGVVEYRYDGETGSFETGTYIPAD